ncbi:hypothetical protein [Muricoccus aerilatus]|uniref:hypothetical protein n=1 Tax=Muricoccus aerilatus TaxID=452982 RepID=UPI001FE232F4|nr:hypothetical protein [Roseomonas aerilata]
MRLREPGEHLALMDRVLMEHVDVAADQLVRAEAGQLLFQLGLGFAHQGDSRWIHVSDREVAIRDHDVRSQGIERRDARQ